MEPLIEIPHSKWAELRDLYLHNWPYGVEPYCLLDNHIGHPGLSKSTNLKVYCPDGDIHSGMIGISDAHEYYLFLCPITSDMTLLALMNTKYVNWETKIVMPSVKPERLDWIKKIVNQKGIQVRYHEGIHEYILSKDSKIFDISCPPGTYVGPMKPEHLSLIDTTWTFTGKHTRKFFTNLMENKCSYVLYSNDHKPIAWIHIDKTGELTHLYCIESERKRGYGEYICKVAINDQLKNGRNVLAYVLHGNDLSQKLFKKLGFDFLGQVNWVFLSKDEINHPYIKLLE